jgi:hypothetical protein
LCRLPVGRPRGRVEGRLGFEEFETKGGDSASRVYIVADAVGSGTDAEG